MEVQLAVEYACMYDIRQIPKVCITLIRVKSIITADTCNLSKKMAVLPEVYIEIESPNLYQFLEMSVHQIRDDFPKTLFSYMKTYIL